VELRVIAPGVRVQPCVNDEGHPIVRVTLTPAGSTRFARLLLALGGTDPPAHDRNGRPRVA
jgi:hypothetical protein